MGFLKELWDQYRDPDDAAAPYTPYRFTPAGHNAPINLSMGRDFARRASIVVVPGVDYFLDGNGRLPGAKDRRELPVSFRVFTNGDNDAAYWLLAAQVLPGFPQRLVYQTDHGDLWYTLGSNPRLQQTETSAGNWGGGGFVDFTVTWTIRDWTPRYSETSEHFHTTSTFAPATTFGSLGVTIISANPQLFNVDTRGTAGVDLPLLPEYGATLTITGPAGGDGGIYLFNSTAKTSDSGGARVGVSLTIPFKLPTSADSATLALASQSFMHNGAAFRPLKSTDSHGAVYQKEWWRFDPGVINACSFTALGANVVLGGSIKADWTRRA